MTEQDLDAFVEEVQNLNQVFMAMADSAPNPSTLEGLAQIREMMSNNSGMFAAPETAPAQARTIPGPDGPIPLRVFPCEQAKAVYLDIHGGGWCMGSAAMMDSFNARVASEAGVAVVSVEYRLAPENPHPAGLDDCVAAAEWLLDNAHAEFGVDKILLAGGSAGAHLALCTLLRLRDSGRDISRIIGINLLVGVYDLTGTPSQRNASGLAGSWDSTKGLVDYLLPGTTTEERKDPAYSPLYADLTGLPPALFTAAALDALVDDSRFMAARWKASGNEGELMVFPECTHIFVALPTKLAEIANERQLTFVRERVAASAS